MVLHDDIAKQDETLFRLQKPQRFQNNLHTSWTREDRQPSNDRRGKKSGLRLIVNLSTACVTSPTPLVPKLPLSSRSQALLERLPAKLPLGFHDL